MLDKKWNEKKAYLSKKKKKKKKKEGKKAIDIKRICIILDLGCHVCFHFLLFLIFHFKDGIVCMRNM